MVVEAGGGAGDTMRQINEGGGGSARCRVRVWGCHGLVEGGGLVESEKCVTELKVGRRGRGKHEEHERRSQ
jgi:hypothetical protein